MLSQRLKLVQKQKLSQRQVQVNIELDGLDKIDTKNSNLFIQYGNEWD